MNPLVTQIRATRQRFLTLFAALGALLYTEVNPDAETLSLQAEATTALRSSRNWLGEVLKYLGEANPYPTSNDPSVATVEPTADLPVDVGAQVALLFPSGMDLIAKVKTLRSQFKTEIAGLTSLWQNFPQPASSGSQSLNAAPVEPAFNNMGFVASENAMCALIEANHALGWILAANGTVAETPATPIPDSAEPTATTPVIPLPDATATPTPEAATPDVTSPAPSDPPVSPNVDAPADLPNSSETSETPGASSPVEDTPAPQPETPSQPDLTSEAPTSSPVSPSSTDQSSSQTPSEVLTPTPQSPAATDQTNTPGSESPTDPPVPSDGQLLLDQITGSYPTLVNSVQTPLSLKEAGHIVLCYPDKAFRDAVLDKMKTVQLEELDNSGATSILSVYTSFMALAILAEDEAEQANTEPVQTEDTQPDSAEPTPQA